MNKRFLKQIFRAFEMNNRCCAGDDGAGGGGGSTTDKSGSTVDDSGKTVDDGDKLDVPDDLFANANIADELKDDEAFIQEIKDLKDIKDPEKKEDVDDGEVKFEKDVELNYKDKDDSEAKTVVVDKVNDNGSYNIIVDGKVIENVKPETLSAIELKYEKDNDLVYKEKEDSEGEEAVVEKRNEDGTYNIKVGDKVIENVKIENLAKPEETTYTYENDVTIDGLTFKKEMLQKTPVEVLENIGKIISTNKDLTDQLATVSTANNEFSEDPVIKQRMKRLEEGKGDVAYAAYGMSKDTRKHLEETLELKEDEIVALNKEFEKDMIDNVNLAVNSILLKNKNDQDVKEQGKKGMDVLLAFGDINPEFKVKETNIENFWLKKEKHPEWNTFIKGTGRYQKHLREKLGYERYSELAKFSENPKALYALIATDLGEPVAFNTKARDTKIRQSERDKMLEIFNPKKLSKVMKPAKAKVKTSEKEATIVDFGAIDKNKLNDDVYVGKLIDNAKDDDEIFQIQQLVLSHAKV